MRANAPSAPTTPVVGASFTVAAVAERYGVTAATVLAWIRGGELAAVNVSRSFSSRKPRYRISTAALEAFEAHRAPAPPLTHRHRRKRPGGVIEFYK